MSSDQEEPGERFDPGRYWDEMHRNNTGYSAVGFGVLGIRFNNWMYEVRARVLRRAVRRASLEVEGASVLDVGAGTGFYVREWQKLGAKRIIGVDLSDVAVERLTVEIPAARFLRADISDPIPSELGLGSGFDIVSAFDVLFHIIDDRRFARAIENLAELTRIGGHLLLSENFLRGQSALRELNQVSRSRTEIDHALTVAGFETVLRLPMFVLMNSPVDSRSRLHHLFWRGLAGICRRSDRGGAILGAACYLPELLLTAIMEEGPSTELIVCQRT